ncbi:sushi domain-containing protein 3 [Cynoglossus semilaevis]|uniref:sushi domain-containing protein 3 n=1 Tax=Cynoglossus semilaevis TaxID=244447 RepID=UPI0007DCA3F6|nr:sushi domain-containing protein 3-like [Cynoglossus semilaevis]XP_016889961.1 sushi domain-containing protein 3-like [Cynoglossus semilaevis]
MSITVTSGLGCGRRLLWSVFWTLVVAEGSTLDLQNNRTRSVEENWTSSTTELQPNLRTEAPTQGTSMTATGPSCDPVQPPRRGSFFVDRGTGASVGSVLTFWCREGYQLVGSDQVHCSIRTGRPEWSPPPPVCEASARPWDRGLRAAVLVSVVSGGVILAMTLSFIICCLQERCRKEGRGRRREPYSTCGTQCWLDRGEGGESDLQPPKIFHLSQRMNPHLAPDSALYLTGGQSAYENRGYQR